MHDCDNCRYVLKDEDEEPCVRCVNNYQHHDMWEPTEDKVVLKQRCKDCRYYFGNDDWKSRKDSPFSYSYIGLCTRHELNFEVSCNDFCSFSEAKDAEKG